MERLTKTDGIGQRDLIRCFDCSLEKAGENLEHCGYCEEGWQRALERLAAYEDTGLEPEEITAKPYPCVFYCNRHCALDNDFCAEGPGCQKELSAEDVKHLLELAEADRKGEIIICKTDYTGKCGTCKHFERDGDTRNGWCRKKQKAMRTGEHRHPRYSMSRIKCREYIPTEAAQKGGRNGD